MLVTVVTCGPDPRCGVAVLQFVSSLEFVGLDPRRVAVRPFVVRPSPNVATTRLDTVDYSVLKSKGDVGARKAGRKGGREGGSKVSVR